MRFIIAILLMISVSGCSSLNTSLIPAPAAQGPTLGMTRAQVAALMTKMVVVGYEIDPSSGAAKPLEVKSFYSTEMLPSGNENYLVDSYITGVLPAGQRVKESGLTPMIFKNDILCGTGHESLAALKAGHGCEK
ncbi:MAG: hypothetical protein WCO69_07310 [Candidatus Omnitrophota bacterium]